MKILHTSDWHLGRSLYDRKRYEEVAIPDKALMVETKSTQHRDDNGEWNKEILAKAVAGAKWCENASQHLLANGGKEWKYLLIPHDEVKEHNVIESFVQRFIYTTE